MPLVVMEAEMSTITPLSLLSGKPSAKGLGVNTAWVPPKGATLAELASEQASTISKSSCNARNKYTARQAMWWLRRMTRDDTPSSRARGVRVSMACFISQGPGRRWPSHSRAAGRSETTKGAPWARMLPVSNSLR